MSQQKTRYQKLSIVILSVASLITSTSLIGCSQKTKPFEETASTSDSQPASEQIEPAPAEEQPPAGNGDKSALENLGDKVLGKADEVSTELLGEEVTNDVKATFEEAKTAFAPIFDIKEPKEFLNSL